MQQLRSFSIDFNWLHGTYSPPDTFARADASVWAAYCQQLGCTNFWTFAVSYNGRAWYDSRLSPKIQGLEGNFTRDCVREGHRRDMSVFAYHCLGYNPVQEKEHPSWSRHNPDDLFNMIFCDAYLDWFCQAVQESVTEGGYDGLVIDWFRCPHSRKPDWREEEIRLYEQLMGEPFRAVPDAATLAEFEKRSIERAWRRIREAVSDVRDIPIWTNQPFERPEDPVWNGNILMKEADYILNECPDIGLLDWMKRESGEHTCIVQNLCGWANHDLSALPPEILETVGLFGFAAADPETCLPYTEERCPDDTARVNARNIREIDALFHSTGRYAHIK